MSRDTSSRADWLVAVEPYRKLSKVYDAVMEHVDYASWAEYIVDILLRHHSEAQSLLELGCGTGTFALAFHDLLDVEYVATDGMQDMVDLAREKLSGTEIDVQVVDFVAFSFDRQFDVVLMLYDCFNYLLEQADIYSFLSSSYSALVPGGLLIFDQSTPANSENNEGDFDYGGQSGTLEYSRRSSYNKRKRTHLTDFTIVDGENKYWERHRQKAYTLKEVAGLLGNSPFHILASYEDFSFRSGNDLSERLHWVVQRNAD